MFVKYLRSEISIDKEIQQLAERLAKLEMKAITRLIEDMEVYIIMEKFLTIKEQDIYYKSQYKLMKMLGGELI